MPTSADAILKKAEIDKLVQQGIVDKNNKDQMKWLESQVYGKILALVKLAKELGLDAKQALTDTKKATPAAAQPTSAGLPAIKASPSDSKTAKPEQVVAAQGSMKTFMKGFVSMLKEGDFKFGKEGVNLEQREIGGTKFLVISGDKVNDPKVKAFLEDMKAKGIVRDPTPEETKKIQSGISSPPAQKTDISAAAAAAAAPTPLPTSPRMGGTK